MSAVNSWVYTYHSLSSGHQHRTDTVTWSHHMSNRSDHRVHMSPLLPQRNLWKWSQQTVYKPQTGKYNNHEHKHLQSPFFILLLNLSSCLLRAIRPAPPLVQKKFVAAFGTADAVITCVHAGLTVWQAVLTQLSGRVCVGAGWTLHYTWTVLIQKISCDTKYTHHVELETI